MQNTIPLSCGLCGKKIQGRQWPKAKKGNSICTHCISWLKKEGVSNENLHERYGDEGYHFNI